MEPKHIVLSASPFTFNISPFGFHRYASEFAGFAEDASSRVTNTFSPVPYYLYCRAIELVLKAFLLAKGLPKRQLKERSLGHDLGKILAKAKELGLETEVRISVEWEKELAKANVYYATKGFEYFEVMDAIRGYPYLPLLAVLAQMCTTLLANLKRICLDA